MPLGERTDEIFVMGLPQRRIKRETLITGRKGRRKEKKEGRK